MYDVFYDEDYREADLGEADLGEASEETVTFSIRQVYEMDGVNIELRFHEDDSVQKHWYWDSDCWFEFVTCESRRENAPKSKYEEGWVNYNDNLEDWVKSIFPSKDKLASFILETVMEQVRHWNPRDVMVEFFRERLTFSITVFRRDDYLHEKKRLQFPCPTFVDVNEQTQKDSFIQIIKWYIEKVDNLSPGQQRANEIVKQFNFISSHLEVLNRPVFKRFKTAIFEKVMQFYENGDEKYFPKGFLKEFTTAVFGAPKKVFRGRSLSE